MVPRYLILNGPNLDRLGTRDPETYGRRSLADVNQSLASFADAHGVELDFRQHSAEDEIIAAIHGASPEYQGIVINPGAYTHTSRALGDAIDANPLPVVEVHISNVLERDNWRRRSLMPSSYRVYGRGTRGYQWAILRLLNQSLSPADTIAYGPLPDQIFEWRPHHGAGRLVVLIHGGLWRHEWERDTTESLAVDLHRRGFATANLEYRRIGLGGGWPESFSDVELALTAIPQLTGFPTEAIVILGHSAGATMALWAGHQGLTVSLAPFTDLVEARQQRWAGSTFTRLLEEPLDPPESYSPFHRLPRPGEALVFASPTDDIIPYSPIISYVERAQTLGGSILLTPTEGSHFDFLKPSSSSWGLVVEELEARNRS